MPKMHWTQSPIRKGDLVSAIKKGWRTRRKKARKAEKLAKTAWKKKPESAIIRASKGSTITITISVS